jgi:hypothetical protein
MIRKIFNFIGQVLTLGLAALLAGVLYVGGYFYMKSSEPMTVAESQQRAPGLTFRDFWASRVEEARDWDKKLSEAGVPRKVCEPTMTGLTIWRSLIAVPFVVQSRLVGQGSVEYYDKVRVANNNAVPNMDLLYNGPLLDAAWATFEEGSWWQFANDPGTPSNKVPGGRMCKNTYPTPADVSANRDAADAMP